MGHKRTTKDTIRFIDLFAGIGGIRKGLEQACADAGIGAECVFTSEIKEHAISVLRQNHPGEDIAGDITQVKTDDIPDFDVLLAGFPCQAFSAAGKRLGFEDTRGTLFFDVARILDAKRPAGFILENVEGLVSHDKDDPKSPMGKTLATILGTLDKLGYKVSWRVLNAKDFALPQDRKRIYITGTTRNAPCLEGFHTRHTTLASILQHGQPCAKSRFIDLVLKHYDINRLPGKSFKDKRGGTDNIHSWDIGLKGPVTDDEKHLLTAILTERRKRKWADDYGIDWMDGMPLTYGHIASFYNGGGDLQAMLDDLTAKGYLKREHPKRKAGNRRVQDTSLPLGYNIVAGKMSFAINKVLDPAGTAPTLVAMDMERLYVVDGTGIRNLTLREGLRLFGYPDNYAFDIPVKQGYDLLGNTVAVPVIKAVAARMLDALND